jgi:hypothetical protein
MFQIEDLTPEQESLISVYCEKWRRVVLSTERLDRDRAAVTIRTAYAISKRPEPEIVFCESPLVAIRELQGRALKNYYRHLYTYLLEQLKNHFRRRFNQQCSKELQQYIQTQINQQFNQKALSELFSFLNSAFFTRRPLSISSNRSISAETLLRDSIKPNAWVNFVCYFDYCSSVLGIVRPQSRWNLRWQTLQDLLTTCGWIFAYDAVCVVCEHPVSLELDELGQLHAEGKAAIAFADGLKLYAYHGHSISEEYGLILPEQWKHKLLQEEISPCVSSVLLPSIQLHVIEQLSQEQEALIPIYRDKWQELRLASRTIDRHHAAEAVNSVYELLKLPKPKILFFSNPEFAINYLKNHPEQKQHPSVPKSRLTNLKWPSVGCLLESQLKAQLKPELIWELRPKLLPQNRWRGFDLEGFGLGRPFEIKLGRYFPISPPFWWRLWGEGYGLATCQPDVWAANGALFDFCFTVLGCEHNHQIWQAFQMIPQECGYLFPYEEICIICDRPIQIRLDERGRLLHAEGEPALLFADGTCVYAQHGERVPAKDETTEP